MINVPKFYHYYLLSFSLAIVNLVVLLLVFRMRTATQLLGADDTWKGAPEKPKSAKQAQGTDGAATPATPAPEAVVSVPVVDAVAGLQELERGLAGEPVAPESTGTKMKAMLSDKRVYLLAGFLLLYVGMEVSTIEHASFRVQCSECSILNHGLTTGHYRRLDRVFCH